jgi:hypothetical protein
MNDYLSPYFGPELQRHVVLVKEGEPLDRRSDWLIAAPGVRPIACPADMKTVLTTPGGWLVAKRVGTSNCTPNRL